MSIALRQQGIRKSMRGFRALDRVDFAVEAGSLTGLIGLNGAGKTTTLRILLGLLDPDSGTSEVLGLPSREIATVGHRVGAQLHGGGVDPSLTCLEALQHFARLHGRRRIGARTTSDFAVVLERVGLEALADRRAGKLSAGERQRLSLGRALLARPEVLVLDEPLTHLDPGAAERIVALLRAEADRGAAILVSSHQLEFLDRLASQVVFLHRGAVIATGSPRELLASDGAAVRIVASPCDRAGAAIAADPTVLSHERIGTESLPGSVGEWRVVLRCSSTSSDESIAALAAFNDRLVRAECSVSCLAPERRTLHDLFLERVRAFEREGGKS